MSASRRSLPRLELQSRAAGTTASIHVYPGAYDDFDWPNVPVHALPAFRTRAGVVPIEGTDASAKADAVQRVSAFVAELASGPVTAAVRRTKKGRGSDTLDGLSRRHHHHLAAPDQRHERFRRAGQRRKGPQCIGTMIFRSSSSLQAKAALVGPMV